MHLWFKKKKKSSPESRHRRDIANADTSSETNYEKVLKQGRRIRVNRL